MNLAEKLMKLDRGQLTEVRTGEIEIKRMSQLTGEPFVIRCKALSGDRYTELSAGLLDEDHELDFARLYQVNTMLATEGVTEPDLKSEELQKHFGCATPKDLACMLFQGGEMQKVADLVTELSGFGEESKKKLKN